MTRSPRSSPAPRSATASATPSFPDGPIGTARARRDARLERARGNVAAVRGGRARARAPGGARRRLGRADLRRPPQRGRAARRPGPRARSATASSPRSSAGRLRAGVWGGDPVPARDRPRPCSSSTEARCCAGVKTFCSGAGGLDRALVLARQADGGPPVAVWIDLTDEPASRSTTAGIARTGCGRRSRIASCSTTRRCSRGSARPGRSPSSRGSPATRSAPRPAGRGWPTPPSAPRSTSSRGDPGAGQLEALAAGRILTAQRTIDVWIERGARAMDAPDDALADDRACRPGSASPTPAGVLLDEAARACGSRPFARGGRARSRAARPRGVPAPAPARPAARARRRSGARGALSVARMSLADFEARYRANPDPWGYTTSDYERRKYEATLTACGDGPFADALELGGSIGVFSALLAPRCERLTTIDAAPDRGGGRAPAACRRAACRRDPRRDSRGDPEPRASTSWSPRRSSTT